MQELKPKNHYIYAEVSLNQRLIDTRPISEGIVFGIVKDICRQYGIKYKQLDRYIEFFAPQSRMQHFIEKLHFSRAPYSNKPF